jgi:ribosomal protein S12 methylthiotransferase accessory factor
VLDWVWVENLLASPSAPARGLLPIDFIRQGSVGHERGELFPETLSNGLASGNLKEEAICHAIEEVIERDGITQFLFRAKYCQQDVRRHYARIALDTLPAPCRALVDKVRNAGRSMTLLNLTTDLHVPIVQCDIGNCGGEGASLNPERAIVRAITEAAQTSTLNIQGAREDLAPGSRDPRVHDGSGLEAFRVRQVLYDPFLPEIPYDTLPSRKHAFVDEDLAVLLETLRRAGIRDVFVCDVSDDQFTDFHVVRVVIPELETFRNDAIGPRRLRYALSE